MPRPGQSSQSSKMRKKRAAARAAAAAAAPEPEPEPPAAPTAFNPAPAPMPPALQEPVPADASEWDVHALNLLKRLGKRDATTRLRAASELLVHVGAAPDTAGGAFLARFAGAFHALVADGHPRVRAGVLAVAGAAAQRFRARCKDALPVLAPHWVGATADSVAVVAAAACASIAAAFPAARQRARFAEFVARSLADFCFAESAALPAEKDAAGFAARAARLCAVAAWPAHPDVARPELLAEFVDAPTRPLAALVEGVRGAHGLLTAPAPVCRAAVAILAATDASTATDAQRFRAEQFAEIALAALPVAPDAWDLLLVLFARGWGPAALGEDLPGLAEALTLGIEASTPQPLSALLPLLAALPSDSAPSAAVAEAVLAALRGALGLADGEKPPPLATALRLLPPYVECARFVYATGSNRWQVEQLRAAAASEHLAPALREVLSGGIAPCPKRHRAPSKTGRTPPDPAKDAVGHLSTAVMVLDEAHARVVADRAAESFLEAMKAGQQDSVRLGARYASALDEMSGSACGIALATGVLQRIVAGDSAVGTSSLVGEIQGVTIDEGEQVPGSERLAAEAERSETPVTPAVDVPAVLCALAASVNIVPALGEEERSLRQRCSEYAAKRASVDPTAVGTVLAWGCGDAGAGAADRAVALIGDHEDDILFKVLAAVLRSHNARRPAKDDSADEWVPLSGIALDAAASRASRELRAKSPIFSSAADFLAELLRASSAAPPGDNIATAVTSAVANSLRVGDVDVTAVVRAALGPGAPVRRPHVQALASAALAWGTDPVASLSVAFLKTVPSTAFSVYADAVLTELTPAVVRPSADLERFAHRWELAVQAVCGDDGLISLDMHAQLLDRLCGTSEGGVVPPVTFLEAVVLHIPLDSLFGGSDGSQFDTKRFLSVYRELNARKDDVGEDACRDLDAHASLLSASMRAELAAEALKRTFSDRDRHLLGIMASAVKPDGTGSVVDDGGTGKAIGPLLHSTFIEQKTGEMDAKVCVLAVEVLEICTACTKRSALDHFRDTLQEATNAVRRDSISRLAQFGVMLLSASLVSNAIPSVEPVPVWLAELVSLALRAIRRFQETQSRVPAQKSKKGGLPSSPLGAGAVLMSRSMDSLGAESLHVDEWRFWALAAQDALLDAQYADPRRLLHQCAVANIAAVAASLVRAHEAGAAPQKIDADQLCRAGAWAAVNFLPALDAYAGTDPSAILPASPAGLASLVVMAAERGVLVRHSEPLPLAPRKVYELTPLLGSARANVRRAALVAIVHGASIDLPEVVKRDYPEQGFSSAQKELRGVTAMIPEPLRNAIEWVSVASGSASGDKVGSLRELSYFLSWRVFLELLANPSTSASSRSGEERSFRRVGIEYLRANEHLFEGFFSRAVAIVVDGDAVEREAAADACSRILAAGTPATKPQGVQLARAQSAPAKSEAESPPEPAQLELVLIGESREREVGAAAGAAFARALQRLPALSRRLGTDRLSHALARLTEQFVEEKVTPLLAAVEIERVREWGAFGGGGDGELHARGSVAGREVAATYTFSDVTLEICLSLPPAFPLQPVVVEMRTRKGMSEARWRKTLRDMTTLLQRRDGSLVEAVELWRRNLDKTFEGVEECPICYSVLHLVNAGLPKMQCRTCKNHFHSECLCKWFSKSNSSACPLCRSAF